MRCLIVILLLLHFCTSPLAATTSKGVTPSSSSSFSANTASAERTSTSTFTRSHWRGRPPTARPTRSIAVIPSTIEDHRHRERHHSSQKPILIFFEVLGGLAALAILASCLRCCYIYNRTPKRDRIVAVLHRHQLDRELEQLERNPFALRRSATNDPVPPYFPPPPTYEVTASTTSAAVPQRSGYVEVSTTSPPPSPPLPARELENAPPPMISRTFIPVG